MIFIPSEEWQAAYPGAAAGVLALRGVANPPEHPELEQRKAELESRLRAEYGGLDRAGLASLPTLQAYAAYYKRFKKSYHVQLQLESVVFKGKTLPRVAALVEAMFMAELQNQLLTAGHDLDTLQLPVQIRVARGDETYTLLRGQEETPKAGDMLMADQQGIISTILYGPDARTQITPATQAALFTVYAPPGIPAAAVQRHLEDIRDLAQLISPAAEVALLQVFTA